MLAATNNTNNTIITSLNAAVSRGEMDKPAAVAALVYYGFESDTANELITDKKPTTNGNTQI
jgi:hypothetical protein